MKSPHIHFFNSQKLQNFLKQFQELEGRHPGLWPLAPRLFCGIGVVLAVVIAGWWFIWTSQWEEFDAGHDEEEKQRNAFVFKLQQAKNLDQLRQQKIQMHKQVEQLEKQLPDKAEMDALLADINQAGINRGLQFELFKPGEIKLHDYYAELPIDIKLTGNYHALASFTSDIAHLSRIVTLDKITINTLREGTQSFETVAHTFRYLDKEEIEQKKKQQAEKKGRK
jgi:type IV pilus assembly protein PilO